MIQENDFDRLGKHVEGVGLLPTGIWADLGRGSDGIGITGHKRFGSEMITYSFDVEINNNLGLYTLNGYQVRLLHVGELDHKVINGIHTAALEQEMAGINWANALPGLFEKDNRIADIFVQLSGLMAAPDPKGAELSELLGLKYLTGTPLEGYFDLSHMRPKYETSLFIPLNGNQQDLVLGESIWLLMGHAVSKPVLAEGKGEGICWMVVENGRISQAPDFDLSGKLSALPFAYPKSLVQQAEYLVKLSSGAEISDKLRINGQMFRARFRADPLSADILVMDKQRNKLDLNQLRADPEKLRTLAGKNQDRRKGLGL